MMLSEFIVKTAEKFYEMQQGDGSFPPGHNGPYFDPETPVRNTGHWLIIFAKCYELTGESKFKKGVKGAAEYLYSKEAIPYGYSFYHRYKEGKDKCNGLIGQAWTFEALAEAKRVLKDRKYALLAEEVFFQHPFDEGKGLWNRLDVDGEILSVDIAFNHQLWFAACASLIDGEKTEDLINYIKLFMDKLSHNMVILENGLIYHNIKNSHTNIGAGKKIKRTFKRVLIRRVDEITHKSIGYHCFNTYAFGILKQQIPEHPFWHSEYFERATDYLLTEEYREGLSGNKYSYPYNPPGFEIPYSLYTLKEMDEKELLETSQWWVNQQFKACYNRETGMMDRNTDDPLTHTARIYEVLRLTNDLLQKISLSDEHFL